VTPSLIFGDVAPPLTWRSVDGTPRATACGFPRCAAVVLIDLSDDMGARIYRDLRRPWVDFTIGGLDLVGTHSIYRDEAAGALVARLLDRAPSAPPVAPAAIAARGPEATPAD
jgi:hypothetical protein